MELNRKKFYTILKTPLGHVGIIFHPHPFSLVKVLLPEMSRGKIIALAERETRWNGGGHVMARRITGEIKAYFNGTPIQPCWKHLFMDDMNDLQRCVLAATASIPYGKTASYQQIAEAVGRPRACRFVGSTLAKNPFPIIIPCHRVIRSDGTIGRFGGGVDLKQKLIHQESQNILESTKPIFDGRSAVERSLR